MSGLSQSPTDAGPPAEPVHDWLLYTPGAAYRPAAVMLAVREAVESLPQTKATFAVSDVIPERFHTHAVEDEMFYLLGSWQNPLTSSKVKTWVNPAYPHRLRFSDVVARCACGKVVARAKADGKDLPHDGPAEHRPSCTQAQKLRAKADLSEARAAALRQGIRHGQSGRQMHDRLGLRKNGTVGHITESLCVDTDALKAEFRQSRRNTMVHLLHEWPTDAVAAVYGISAGRVRDIISAQTSYDIAELTAIRQNRGAE